MLDCAERGSNYHVSRQTPQVEAVTPEAVEDVPIKLVEISPVLAY